MRSLSLTSDFKEALWEVFSEASALGMEAEQLEAICASELKSFLLVACERCKSAGEAGLNGLCRTCNEY